MPGTPRLATMALAPLRERLRHVPAPVADAGLAVAVALAVSVAIGVSTEAGSRVPDLLAHLLGLAIGVPVLFRRRWPLGMLTVSAAILLLYYSADYPGIPPAVPLGVTVYTAAAAGRLRGAVLVVVALYGTGIVFRLGEDERALALLSDTVREAALVGALFFLGDAVRSRRAYAEEVRERLHRAEAERDHEARRRVAEERLRIARELHDVIAHTVSVITVHAGVAADVLDDRPDLARSALGTIRTAGREALDELRTTVGVLRASGEPASDQPPTAPAPGLAQIENLLETARRTGLGVAVVVEGDRRPLPAAVDLAGYRIVQESLTNVIRHAGAAHATVSIRYRPGCVEVEIGDDGCGSDRKAGGHGLAGMRERAKALGGELQAGRSATGGFTVVAHIPTARPAG